MLFPRFLSSCIHNVATNPTTEECLKADSFLQILSWHVQSIYNAMESPFSRSGMALSRPNPDRTIPSVKKYKKQQEECCIEDEEGLDEPDLSSRLILHQIGKHLHDNHNHHKVSSYNPSERECSIDRYSRHTNSRDHVNSGQGCICTISVAIATGGLPCSMIL